MAHKESDILALDEKYTLGKYEFSIETREIPQTSLMDVIAKATGPAGKMGAKTIQVPKSTEINGWYVDANSTTADVYIKAAEGLDISPVVEPIPSDVTGHAQSAQQAIEHTYGFSRGTGLYTSGFNTRRVTFHLWASEDIDTIGYDEFHDIISGRRTTTNHYLDSTFEYQNKKVYYKFFNGAAWRYDCETTPACNNGALLGDITSVAGAVAWTMVYGSQSEPVDVPPEIEQYYPFDYGNKLTYLIDGRWENEISAEPGTAITSFQESDGGRLTYVRAGETGYNPWGALNQSYTYNGKTVYFGGGDQLNSCSNVNYVIYGIPYNRRELTPYIAWAMIYGADSGTTGDILVGRFAIDNRIAGATAGNGGAEPGPDGQPWQDVDDGQPTLWPGDEGYPDPEDPDYPGDDEPYYPPSKTLYLDVEGALSGRHNDPLNDTSYSYLPADKDTVKSYGYGGDGGHGGGGGGGASTVIVYKFATDKADSKEITVKPKRHGYGSGGGKGGKGGDGCILIYY